MKNLKKYFKGFTLVELIIVITILAILATIAFVSFQSYTKDARDANRTATIKNIEKGLELFTIKTNNYPAPDESTPFTGWLDWKVKINQWIVWENVARVINMNTTPLDPNDKSKYTYSTFWDDNKYYQVAINAENAQTSFIPQTYAFTPKSAIVQWNYRFDPSLPSLIVVPSSVNTSSGIFDPKVCFVVDGWQNSLSSNSGSCLKKEEMSLKEFDSSLVWYWDMETTFNSWSIDYLKDLSNNLNYWVLEGWINIWWTDWYIWRWTYFDWVNNNISILNEKYWTWFNWFWTWTGETVSYIFGIEPTTSFDTTNMITMTRSAEMTSCIWTWYLIFRDNKWNWITIQNYPINLWKFYLFSSTYDIYSWKMRLYINWILLDEKLEWVFQPWWWDWSFYIWTKASWCSWVYFNWILDEIKIYNRTLLDEEIRQQAKIAGF